ncbi:MAG: hypothetical protein AAGE13_15090, partial [Pseudomonadota bacterium]
LSAPGAHPADSAPVQSDASRRAGPLAAPQSGTPTLHGDPQHGEPQQAPASALVLRAASNPAAVNPLLLTQAIDGAEDTPPDRSPGILPRSALRLPPASGTPVPARAPVVRARRPGDELPETVEPVTDYRQVVAQRARKPRVQSGRYRGRTGFLAGVLVSSAVLAGFVLLPGSQLLREIQGFDIGLLVDAVKGPDAEPLSLPSPLADAEANPVSSDPVYVDPAAADLASAEQVPPLLTNAKRPPPQLSVGPRAASIEPEFPEPVRLAVLTPRGRVLSCPPPRPRPATLTRPVITDPTLTDPTLTDPTLTDPTLTELLLSNPSLADLALTDPTVVEPGRRPTVAVLVPEGETPQRIMLQLSDGTPEEQKIEIMERLFQDGYYDIKLEEVNLGEFMSELFRASLGLEDEEHKWIFNESRRSGDRVYILRDPEMPDNE